MTQIAVLLLLLLSSGVRAPICPEGICDLVTECIGSPKSEKDCPPLTTYAENVWQCDCCPACVKYKFKNEPCTWNATIGGGIGTDEEFVNSNECATGLVCLNGICRRDPRQDRTPCWDHYHEYLEEHDDNYWMWEPDCDSQGNYKPRQCKGDPFDGRCHCVDIYGNIIYGSKYIRDGVEDMNCECSRKYMELVKDDVSDITLVCESDGNYRELQCQNGYCFCMNPIGFNESTTVVPESMISALPCYKPGLHKESYLADCSLELHRQQILYDLFIERGTILLSLPTPSCNPDQTFTVVQCTTEVCFCITRENSQGTVYCDLESNVCDDMNCFCERDKEDSESTGVKFPYSCFNVNGNYESYQEPTEGVSFCVDETGYQDSNIYDLNNNPELACCLWCSDESIINGTCIDDPMCTEEPTIINRFM